MGLMPVAIGQECDFGKIKWQTRDCREGVKLVFRDDGVIVEAFTDSGGGDWFRAQTLGAVINTAVGRNNATTCGYNRAEFVLE